MRCDEAAYFGDTLQAKTLIPSAGCVLDTHVGAAAAIAASKLLHRHNKGYGQSGTAVAATVPLHVVQGATGTLVGFKAGCIGLCTGDATITVDLKNNGVSILTAAVELDAADTARVLVAGVFSATAVVAGDFLEAVVTVNAGTGALGTGLCVQLELDETPI